MSRIHDGLKKAEQERIAGQAPDLATPIPGPSADSEPRSQQASARASDLVRVEDMSASAVGVAPEGYLRFEDLLAHCAHPHWRLDPSLSVFSGVGFSSRGAEPFRTLRSRLYQMRNNQPIRTVLVTSAVPAEGKTFVASNLAQAIIRQPDRRVLLIDADLRSPRLHLPFGAPSSPGLTDYLRGEADEAAVIQCGQESNLCLIPGGNEVTNPSELLSNARMKDLIDRLTPLFDWIILDSPPCLPVADPTILADHCDAILLVVRASVTPSDVAQRALQELRDRVAGVVLNGVEEDHTYGSYSYGNYGYAAAATKGHRPPGA